ncbi:hypothetical protein HYW76_02180 [Candidatus Pacearchaeota archaeon]|nr:hypothetical protein [Candidatus Pacearchaeota archaeon]
MLPKYHFFAGIIISAILLLFFPSLRGIEILIIFLSSILLDIDHYFIFAKRSKKLGIKDNYNWGMQRRAEWDKLNANEKRKVKITHFYLHGIEFLVLLIVLSFFSVWVKYILFGAIIHLCFDYIEIIHKKDPLFIKFSQIYVGISNKHKKSMLCSYFFI